MQEEALQGNENIEQAIAALQQNATPELLAHALTAIRRRIQNQAHGLNASAGKVRSRIAVLDRLIARLRKAA